MIVRRPVEEAGHAVASRNSRPEAADAHITNMSKAMAVSDQNG
jgi:hypothetical protein